MVKVVIYTTQYCPYCVRAKQLLNYKGVAFDEIDIGDDDESRQKMIEESDGRRTVPQIFIDGAPIGGCDELYALDQEGELDRLLAA